MREQLNDQIGFLRSSCEAFDEGKTAEAARIATCVRVLINDSRTSTSLLTHLGQRGKVRITTQCERIAPDLYPGQSVLAYLATYRGSAWYLPRAYDEVLRTHLRSVSIEEWWTEGVGLKADGESFDRRTLTLAVANQDGGAHVDARLEESYFNLSRTNSLGWTVHHEGEPVGSPGLPMPNPVPVYMRQIGQDLLLTFKAYRRRFSIDDFDLPFAVDRAWCGDPVRPLPEGTGVHLVGPELVLNPQDGRVVSLTAWARSSRGDHESPDSKT